MVKTITVFLILCLAFVACKKRRLDNGLCDCANSLVQLEVSNFAQLVGAESNESVEIVYDYSGCCTDNQINVNIETTSPSCFDGEDGYIKLEISGGNPPYNISVSDENYMKNNYITGLKSGLYDITINDATECQLIISNLEIPVSNNNCLKIPNVFTPNGDGINDTWFIQNINTFTDYKIYIFNRRNKHIHTVKHGDNYWNGTVDNQLLPDGAYRYKLVIGDFFMEGYVCILTQRLPKDEYECSPYLTPAIYDDPYITYW